MPIRLYRLYTWWRLTPTCFTFNHRPFTHLIPFIITLCAVQLHILFYQQKGAWLRKQSHLYHIYAWKINNNHPFFTKPSVAFAKKVKHHFKSSQLFLIFPPYINPLLWTLLLLKWKPNKFSKHGIRINHAKHLFKSGKKSSYMAFKSKFF
jgi:hypothetical protein